MSKSKSKAAASVETARSLIEDPQIRRAVADAATQTGQLGFSITKRVARRRTRKKLERYLDIAQSVGPVIAQYGPQVAQSVGLSPATAAILKPPPGTPQSKQGRSKLLAGVALGAGAVLLLEPGAGASRRQALLGVIGK